MRIHSVMTLVLNPLKQPWLLTVISAVMLLFAFSMIFFQHAPAYAALLQGFSPKTYKNGVNFGSGVYFSPHHLVIYQSPSEKSAVLEELTWSKQQGAGFSLVSAVHNQTVPLNRTFICYYPEIEVAMMAVIDESAGLDEDGQEITDPNIDSNWVQVVYDQSKALSGWVPLQHADISDPTRFSGQAHFGVYQPWQEFMTRNAKPYGIYWLTGVSQYHRGVRQASRDDASIIPVTIIRDMKIRHVRGNWLLVEVVDFQRNTPIGWVRWRDEAGNLMVFPNLSQEKIPVVVTGY